MQHSTAGRVAWGQGCVTPQAIERLAQELQTARKCVPRARREQSQRKFPISPQEAFFFGDSCASVGRSKENLHCTPRGENMADAGVVGHEAHEAPGSGLVGVMSTLPCFSILVAGLEACSALHGR